MTRHAAILQAILQLGQCWTDRLHEPYVDWQVRADTIAEAIDTVARTNEEAAFLVYMAWHEGKNSLSIHSGDSSRHRGRRCWSLWQICELPNWLDWREPVVVNTSAESTTETAMLALHIYLNHRGTGTLVDGIRGYGGYKRWSPTPRRLAGKIREIERKIDAMTSEDVR